MMQIEQFQWHPMDLLLYCRSASGETLHVSRIPFEAAKDYWISCPQCGARAKARMRKHYDANDESKVGVPRMFLARLHTQAGQTLLKMLPVQSHSPLRRGDSKSQCDSLEDGT